MGTKRTHVLMAIAVLLTLLSIAGKVTAHPPADEPPAQGGLRAASVVSPLLQYQGRLTEPSTGAPVADGSYTMIFRLYTVASGGSPLWVETKDVSVQNGLFSTVLGTDTALDQSLFSGQALWLGVKVGADPEATPRQQVLPVAYALSLAPGAVISATSSSPILQVRNTGSGTALSVAGPTVLEGDLSVSGSLTGGSHSHSGADIISGTVTEARIDAAIARDAEVTAAITAHTAITDAHHTRYTDAEAWSAVLAKDGPASGLDADLLDGSHASDFARAAHTHDDRYYTEEESDFRFVNATGPERISGSSTDPILRVTQTGSGPAIYAAGNAQVTGDLTVNGAFQAPRRRYVPITVGDLMYDENNDILWGDCCNGVLFIDGSQSGGSITFPLPEDYQYGTTFSLDLYLIPLDSGSGALDFFVRWVGLVNGGWSGTGSSATTSPVSLGTVNYIHKQSFTLSGFSSASPPELVELTIRRMTTDTYAGRVTLIGLRLSYQALR